MAKVLKCNAIFLGCGHIVRADSEEELVRLAAEHARQVHGVDAIDDAMARQVMAAIKDE
jgi:predicted small metal-binding protein